MARRSKRNAELAAAPPPADAFHLATPVRPRPAFAIAPEAARAHLLSRAGDLLAEHGIAVVHEAARAAMLKAGATPGREPIRIRLPRALQQEALAATPKTVTLCGKRPERDVE
ncbi:MAG: hypothetical protein D6811_13540, partial [Alphaproteobacteria bacterium]